ncbi:MAG TPA: FAD-dependent oxidoreductase, partial [Verrucomicrobiales bacterium]|nr:FAD-dependent oxidoreductase [Verrucomicrobiales bacterium]
LYEVRVAYPANNNRASNVPVTIFHNGGETKKVISQKPPGPVGGVAVSLGEYEFSPDRRPQVVIGNEGTDGYVVIDAVQWIAK